MHVLTRGGDALQSSTLVLTEVVRNSVQSSLLVLTEVVCQNARSMLSTLQNNDLTSADPASTIDMSTERDTETEPEMLLTLKEIGLRRTRIANRTAVLRQRARDQAAVIEHLEEQLRELREDLDWTQRELADNEVRDQILDEQAESLRD